MTFDYQAVALCDHKVHREVYFMEFLGIPGNVSSIAGVSRPVDLSFTTIRLNQPIANHNVRVWLNGEEVLKDDPIWGWSLLKDEFTDDRDPKHKIVFKRPIHYVAAVFEVSYTVRRSICRKCYGKEILYDHEIDLVGEPVTVEKEQLLLQLMIKMLVTRIGSNPFFEFIGTSIADSIFRALRNPGLFQRQLESESSLAMEKIKNIQNRQSLFQTLDLREILNQITNITLEEDEEDPRIFYLSVFASTAAGNEVVVKQELSFRDRFLATPIRQAGII